VTPLKYNSRKTAFKSWPLFPFVVAACALWLRFNSHSAESLKPSSGAGKKDTLYYIPHTHWEGAVFKTREDYLTMGMPRVLQVLRLLKQFPEYTFTLDQVSLIKPFLERYPEEAAAFRKFVAEGRLGIVGGMDVMPDVVKPGGELFVRQMQYGKRYCREELGVEVTTAWLLDTFGFHPACRSSCGRPDTSRFGLTAASRTTSCRPSFSGRASMARRFRPSGSRILTGCSTARRDRSPSSGNSSRGGLTC